MGLSSRTETEAENVNDDNEIAVLKGVITDLEDKVEHLVQFLQQQQQQHSGSTSVGSASNGSMSLADDVDERSFSKVKPSKPYDNATYGSMPLSPSMIQDQMSKLKVTQPNETPVYQHPFHAMLSSALDNTPLPAQVSSTDDGSHHSFSDSSKPSVQRPKINLKK